MIEGDSRVTMCEIAAHVGIWYGNTQSIISDDLSYLKMPTRRVPRVFTEDQKANRLTACERLSTISNREDDFLEHIVTCDETGCIITTRSLSRQAWNGENLEQQHHRNPVLVFLLETFLQLFWNCRDILLVDFLHVWRTVNSAHYCQLLHEVKLASTKKTRRVSSKCDSVS